jgi:hypothetical protein
MKSLRTAAGYIRKNQLRNSKIKEKLSIFNIYANFMTSKSQWKYHAQRREDRRIAKEAVTYQSKKKAKHRTDRIG